MYSALEIGQQTTLAANVGEGCYFDSTDDGLIFIYKFSAPTQEEINAFKSGTPGELRFVRLNDILFILSKLGSLNWVDAPYAIQLSRNLSFPEVTPGNGYPLLFVLIDANTNIVRGLRYISLGTKFSEALHAEVMSDIDRPIVKPIYDMKVKELYNKYTTKSMVKLSNIRYKIGDE